MPQGERVLGAARHPWTGHLTTSPSSEPAATQGFGIQALVTREGRRFLGSVENSVHAAIAGFPKGLFSLGHATRSAPILARSVRHSGVFSQRRAACGGPADCA